MSLGSRRSWSHLECGCAATKRFPEPERQLYRLLRQEGADAYSRYNSLLRELVSFENALDTTLKR
jgi:hypothetical protein